MIYVNKTNTEIVVPEHVTKHFICPTDGKIRISQGDSKTISTIFTILATEDMKKHITDSISYFGDLVDLIYTSHLLQLATLEEITKSILADKMKFQNVGEPNTTLHLSSMFKNDEQVFLRHDFSVAFNSN